MKWHHWLLLLVLIAFTCSQAKARNIADVLAEQGTVHRQGDCTYDGKRAYCLLVTHEKVAYVAIGFVKDDVFYVQHILAEIDGAMVQVWSYNEVRL